MGLQGIDRGQCHQQGGIFESKVVFHDELLSSVGVADKRV
jgi:hypothetical protein